MEINRSRRDGFEIKKRTGTGAFMIRAVDSTGNFSTYFKCMDKVSDLVEQKITEVRNVPNVHKALRRSGRIVPITEKITQEEKTLENPYTNIKIKFDKSETSKQMTFYSSDGNIVMYNNKPVADDTLHMITPKSRLSGVVTLGGLCVSSFGFSTSIVLNGVVISPPLETSITVEQLLGVQAPSQIEQLVDSQTPVEELKG